jgi:hypothetical protein
VRKTVNHHAPFPEIWIALRAHMHYLLVNFKFLHSTPHFWQFHSPLFSSITRTPPHPKLMKSKESASTRPGDLVNKVNNQLGATSSGHGQRAKATSNTHN